MCRCAVRSLIILEVEHGEDTDGVQMLLEHTLRASTLAKFDDVSVINHTVRIDVPPCFVLDSDECDCDIDILDPNCTNPEHINPPEGF